MAIVDSLVASENIRRREVSALETEVERLTGLVQYYSAAEQRARANAKGLRSLPSSSSSQQESGDGHSPQEGTSPKPLIAIKLTDREKALLNFLAQGSTNREIAERIGLDKRTVERGFSALYPKTGTATRTALLRFALDNRLVEDSG